MPGRRPAESPEERALREIEQEDDSALDAIAREAGPPPDSDKLSEADEDLAWETVDSSVDYETMAQQLMTQGLRPEEMQRLLVLKLHPKWAPLYSRPTQDAEMAHQLARLAELPFRLSVLDGIDDPDEMVAKAESLDRRYQRRMTRQRDLYEAAVQVPPPAEGG